jgi:hypothetical protein
MAFSTARPTSGALTVRLPVTRRTEPVPRAVTVASPEALNRSP